MAHKIADTTITLLSKIPKDIWEEWVELPCAKHVQSALNIATKPTLYYEVVVSGSLRKVYIPGRMIHNRRTKVVFILHAFQDAKIYSLRNVTGDFVDHFSNAINKLMAKKAK